LTGKFRPALEALTNDFLFHLLFGKSFVGKPAQGRQDYSWFFHYMRFSFPFLGLLVSISFLLRLHLLGIVSPINKEKRRRQRNIGRPLLLITDHQPIAPLDSPLVSLGNGGSKERKEKETIVEQLGN